MADPLLLSIGPFGVHWYGPMYIAGFMAAWCLGRRRVLQPGSTWTPVQLDQLLLYSVFAIPVGGRVGFILLEGMSEWRADWLYLLKFYDGGMSFNGSICAALMAYESLALKQSRHIGDILDFAAPLAAPGMLVGRIGSYLIRESQQTPAGMPWALRDLLQHPGALTVAVSEGLLLGGALWIFSSIPPPRLAPAGFFLAGYGLIHFLLEFLPAVDASSASRPFVWMTLGRLDFSWMTQGQLLAAPAILVGIVFLSSAYRVRAPSGNVKKPYSLTN